MRSLCSLFVLILLLGTSHALLCNTDCATTSDVMVSPRFGRSGLSYYRPLQMGPVNSYQPRIHTAVVVLHGSARNADEYFCILQTSASLEYGTLDGIYTIAPFFRTESEFAADTLFWESNYDWSSGGVSIALNGSSRVSSFIVLDEIVRTLLQRQYYPNLLRLIVVGHSSGAQATHRYAIGTTVDLQMNSRVRIRYVIANSPSFVYFDTRRALLPSPLCTTYCNSSSIPLLPYDFVELPSNFASCPGFSTWKYGLKGLNEYMHNTWIGDMVPSYLSRDVVYILGDSDTCNEVYNCGCKSHTEELGCEAELQGLCRYQRGMIYYRYLQKYYFSDNAAHGLLIVPDVGHNACGMFTSVEGRRAIFGSRAM